MRFANLPALRAVVAVSTVLAALVSAPAGRARAQQPVPQAQQPLRVETRLVNLFVTARGPHNAFIGNLTQDNFRIFEDGQEQKIAFFAREMTLPITLGMLIDTSGSQQGLLTAEQEAATRFLGRVLRKGDEALVISFDLDVDLLADFTSDQEELARAIHRTRINAPQIPVMVQGPLPSTGPKGTDLYDAVYLACREKLSTEAGRKALILLTDAQDYGSKMKLADAIEAAQRSDAVVYVLLVAEPGQYFGSYQGAGVAKKLAEETGGRVFEVRSGKKLEEAFDEISQELRSQYVLGYYPANASLDGAFRRIKVETAPERLHIFTRKGYYAPKK